MEILTKMCSLIFMLCKSKNKKKNPQTQFRVKWDGVECCPCTKKLQIAKLQKSETCLEFVWEILWRDFGKNDGIVSSFLISQMRNTTDTHFC